MIGKICAAPQGGGSASGAIEYILLYASTAKGASRSDQIDERDRLYAEALERPDLGADVVWQPTTGGGTRPSAIYAHGVTSLATAALEMQAIASANPRVRSAVTHLVLSLQRGVERSDEEMIAGVRGVLDRIGAGDLQYVVAIHRDTDDIHAHIAIGNVDPLTHRAWDRTQIQSRLHRAMRETEIERGWEHDRGLWVVRDQGLSTERVERSTIVERQAWRAEQQSGAKVDPSATDYIGREVSLERFADAVLMPRIAVEIARAQDAAVPSTWADLHARAEHYGIRLEQRGDDIAAVVTRASADLHVQGGVHEARAGDFVLLDRDEVAQIVDQCGPFVAADEAREQYARMLREQPSLVSSRLSLETSVFDSDDIAQHIVARAGETELDALIDIAQADSSLRLLSLEGEQPLYTTASVLEIESQLADDALSLATGVDESFDAGIMALAIADIEEAKGITLDAEQRAATQMLSHRLSVLEAPAGSGKTTIMAALERYAERTNRPIVGLTIGQAAAERLTAESGIEAYNLARAQARERIGEQKIATNAIVVLDEAGMVDSRTAAWLTHIARERGASVVAVGDTGQLQPVSFGASMQITRAAARQTGQYAQLSQIYRHHHAWHAEANASFSQGVHTGDEAKIERAIEILDQHRVISFQDDRQHAIAEATALYAAHSGNGKTALLVASDRETVRHLNESVRRMEGRAGKGLEYQTERGTRQLAAGDRFIFRANSRELGVLNGTTGEVVSAAKREIVVRTDDGSTVSFAPGKYRSWDHGYATTIHSAQGATVDSAVAVLDKSSSAELTYVAITRARRNTAIVTSYESFASTKDLSKHVAENSVRKTTSLTFGELMAAKQKGNQFTASKAREMARANDPQRQRYEAVEAQREIRRTAAVRAAAVGAQAKLKALQGKPLSQVIADRAAIVREQQAKTRAATKRYAPQTIEEFRLAEKQKQKVAQAKQVRPARGKQSKGPQPTQVVQPAQVAKARPVQAPTQTQPVAKQPRIAQDAGFSVGIWALTERTMTGVPMHLIPQKPATQIPPKAQPARHVAVAPGYRPTAQAQKLSTAQRAAKPTAQRAAAKPSSISAPKTTVAKAATAPRRFAPIKTSPKLSSAKSTKPKLSSAQATPTIGGRRTSRVGKALDAMKAKGQTEVPIRTRSSQRPEIYREMALRGMRPPKAEIARHRDTWRLSVQAAAKSAAIGKSAPAKPVAAFAPKSPTIASTKPAPTSAAAPKPRKFAPIATSPKHPAIARSAKPTHATQTAKPKLSSAQRTPAIGGKRTTQIGATLDGLKSQGKSEVPVRARAEQRPGIYREMAMRGMRPPRTEMLQHRDAWKTGVQAANQQRNPRPAQAAPTARPHVPPPSIAPTASKAATAKADAAKTATTSAAKVTPKPTVEKAAVAKPAAPSRSR